MATTSTEATGVSIYKEHRGLDFTAILPTELSQQIFNQIGPESLDSTFLVSKKWQYYSSRAREARGKRHVRILFATLGTGQGGEKVTYWLWSKDDIKVIHDIFADLCRRFALSLLSSFEWSFDNSFEADIAKLLKAESSAVLTIQLRVASYTDRLTHDVNQFKALFHQDLGPDLPKLYGVMTRQLTFVVTW